MGFDADNKNKLQLHIMNLDQVMRRRVEKILPNRDGLKKLMGERKIRIYQGFDPTGSRLHLGHSIGIRKLMDFANLGHEVIFLFGTGTVLVGDPSQRAEGRKLIDQADIEKNIKDWKRQVSPLVDFSKVEIKQNGDWLTKMTLKDIIGIASKVSAVQLFKREMFQRRIKAGDTVWYHETMYPLLQAYDSVYMDVDLEIGGTDQEFNMLIGRELQKKINNREKYVLTVPMILGIDGQQMSKTTGNCVWLDDTPSDMFAKILAIPDEQIGPYLELATNLPINEVERIKKLTSLEAKKELAAAVVGELYDKRKAEAAREEFEATVQKGEVPENIPVYRTKSNSMNLVDLLVESKIAKSRGEVKRLLSQGALEWNGKIISEAEVEVGRGGVLKVGKYRFLKINR